MQDDRNEKITKFYQLQLGQRLREVMEVLYPGERERWGAKKHEDLVGYAACALAVEYQALSGMPIVELLTGDRAIDDPRPQTSDLSPTPVIIHQPPAPTTTEEALPL